jgi:DNA-binding PadR family transcriptional regulator
VKVPRSEIMKRILLTIDKHPSSIYDIQYSVSDLSDPRITRLPKLLKSMEDDGLVTSALQPGPLGPYRRMYQLGPRAHEYLNDSLKDAIETILCFYNINRRKSPRGNIGCSKEPERTLSSGSILFAAFPHLTVDDLEEIRMLLSSTDGISISIVGKDQILSRTGIVYKHLGFDILEIQAESKSVSEIRLRGIPSQNDLPGAIAECKRVLVRNGILRFTAPFIFSEESVNAKLEDFIRSVAKSQFQNLGLVDGEIVQRIMDFHFLKNGSYETQLGEITFWGIKS